MDENAEKESVRKMFVDHEGKKTLELAVPARNVHDMGPQLVLRPNV